MAYCCTVMNNIFMHGMHGPHTSSLMATSLALNVVHASMILRRLTAVWLQGAHMTCVQSACRYSNAQCSTPDAGPPAADSNS